MVNKPCKLWLSAKSDSTRELEHCIYEACLRVDGPVLVFFRADDIGVPSQNFTRMLELFSRHRVPLSLAVIPARITPARWQRLHRLGSHTDELWCWHQHGWRHKNHESVGKKQEFGPARSAESIRRDIVNGRNRLEMILDKDFFPVFTPPWNRCNDNTLQILFALGYLAVSRHQGARPKVPRGLPEFPVAVDLHTRKERTAIDGWKALLEDIHRGIAGGCCGIMLHHQRMNDRAFRFMEYLLETLLKHRQINMVNFKELLPLKTNR